MTAVIGKVVTLTTEVTTANARISDLDKNNNELTSRINVLENDARKNNIIIFGLKESSDPDETENVVDTNMNLSSVTLGVKIDPNDIVTTYRFGRVKGKRPILIKFANIKFLNR